MKPIQVMALAGLLSAGMTALGGLHHAFPFITFGAFVMFAANVYCIFQGGK